MSAATTCLGCGAEPRADARFCDACGAVLVQARPSAEYKQVTVLFADVVHSMDIAATVDTERLRDIMSTLFVRSASVVRRYGGTVDKFTGDGIMALFGAPIALEDHAFRACLAALGIQRRARELATEARSRDGIDLHVRVGLNSGEVIAGDIGSGPHAYTAVGEHVGMAQRMESAAPPDGVLLSDSTARLVEHAAVLGAPEAVPVKGSGFPVPARLLVAMAPRHNRIRQGAPALVGRDRELADLTSMLEQSITGHGCVAGVVGPPGIGKSRLVGEIAAVAAGQGVQVCTTFGESHTSEVPFRVSIRLLRAALGITELDDEVARNAVRSQFPAADPTDLLLIDDVLGIANPASVLPDIAPEARRRRLTALVNEAALARSTPAVYVIEDAHWIDPISEALLADFVSVLPQTRALVLITYRPEYSGSLANSPGAHTIALRPLDDAQSATLITELLGPHPSVADLAAQIAERAAGNPFFAEEIVRDLAGRGVLSGARGTYTSAGGITEPTVPATLQAAIGARIDRLDPAGKNLLSAAAVVGMRFTADLLASLSDTEPLTRLVHAELLDSVRSTPRPEYAFRHPLIRAVAYRAQLKSQRAALHRRLARTIEEQHPDAVDENAALIAEHREAAGDLRAAFDWHMRAAAWLRFRDIKAARMSWQRARDVADRLPPDDPDRTALRIAPRAPLCFSTFRTGGAVAETGFEELRELATAADEKASLAVGMAGQVTVLAAHGRYRESSELATELTAIVESIGDPTMTIALLWAVFGAKIQTGEHAEVLRSAQRVIDLAEGDPTKGNMIVESPLAYATLVRAAVRACRGDVGWKDDIEHGIAMFRQHARSGYPGMLVYKYGFIANAALLPSAADLRDSSEALDQALRYGEDLRIASAQFARGYILAQTDGPARAEGLELLAQARDTALQGRATMAILWPIEIERARERVRTADLDGALALLRDLVENEYSSGEMMFRGPAVSMLVQTLLRRRADGDLAEANAAVERLAAVPTEPGFIMFEPVLLRLRALLARARDDSHAYQHLLHRYREMAAAFGLEGHLVLAEQMANDG